MSSIVTFYSYKGGVGRSMALANVAVLLARRDLKVLAVDWDLEAPGLERYFTYFETTLGGRGLLRMCMDARDSQVIDYKEYASFVNCGTKYPITVLTSGREQDPLYSRNLEAFDWEEFFINQGGAFLEALRQQWRNEFDVVLIDSRTGLSDSGGICTILLPDIVVAMFTANYQSLYGVRDVMRLTQKARQGLAYDRMPLSILPLPARWGVQEFQETRVWLERVVEAFKEFYDDWCPRSLSTREVVERIKLPQADFFGFGEKLAVVEQGTSDPQGMGFVYDRVASFLASDLKDIEALMGGQIADSQGYSVDSGNSLLKLSPSAFAKNVGPNVTSIAKNAPDEDYAYDVFVSYDPTQSDWVLDFLDSLKAELQAIRAEVLHIFFDLREIRTGQEWDYQIQNALLRSKTMVAILTPHYLASQFAVRELASFLNRIRIANKSTLLPVLVRGSFSLMQNLIRGGDPSIQKLGELQWFDFTKYPVRSGPDKRTSYAKQREIMKLAEILNGMIDNAPAYNPHWSTASNADVDHLQSEINRISERDWRRQILWVDDRPTNNVYERRTMESIGITFTLAESTSEALQILSARKYGVIISDMGRREGPREGYVLLDTLRSRGDSTPFIIYAGSNSEKLKREAEEHGAQGSTNDPQELLALVTKVIL